jgi:hypothetical protein
VSQDGDGDIQVASPALVWHAVADCLPLPCHIVFLCQADLERLDYAVGSRREDGWYVGGRPAPRPLSDFSHWLYANRPRVNLGTGDYLAWAVPVDQEGKR